MLARNNMNRSALSSSRSSKKSCFSLLPFLKYLVVYVIGFYCGCILTYEYALSSISARNEIVGNKDQEAEMSAMKIDYASRLKQLESELKKEKAKDHSSNVSTSTSTSTSSGAFYDPSLLKIAQGITKIERDDFYANFDYGTPNDGSSPILLVHHNKASLPVSNSDSSKLSTSIVPMTVKDATENCNFMHVYTVPKSSERMCTAIVENFDNFHVQKWMRQAKNGGPMNHEEKLRVVNRPMNAKGSRVFKVPDAGIIEKHWGVLQKYFANFEGVIGELKPIAEKVAVKNTIIVMTCNFGQSELLMNFVCNAKAKGMDISNVLVFPTDQETKDLAEGLGLATFHDEKNFGHLPKSEARHYADKTFTAMMFAKVVCVQMINHLGYDLLFQDVDVVWNKNPLDYFHDPTNKHHDFDMYFQDDGAHSRRYAPYSANSGFYYVRNTYETRYFFVSLLYASDLIMVYNSHQQPLIQIMTEHASLYNLRVKILDREEDDFPGGWHYNSPRKRPLMKSIAKGEITPYIFHMSWTANKDNKLRYFQQMGEWYTSDSCLQKKKSEIIGEKPGNDLIPACCLAEPNVVCHYRDKPSKIPCKDSPPIDKGRGSFW